MQLENCNQKPTSLLDRSRKPLPVRCVHPHDETSTSTPDPAHTNTFLLTTSHDIPKLATQFKSLHHHAQASFTKPNAGEKQLFATNLHYEKRTRLETVHRLWLWKITLRHKPTDLLVCQRMNCETQIPPTVQSQRLEAAIVVGFAAMMSEHKSEGASE